MVVTGVDKVLGTYCRCYPHKPGLELAEACLQGRVISRQKNYGRRRRQRRQRPKRKDAHFFSAAVVNPALSPRKHYFFQVFLQVLIH